MRLELGLKEASELFEALCSAPSVSVRCHPKKNAGAYLSEREIPWSRYGRRLASRPVFTLDPLFHAGAYYPQDASSQFMDFLSEHFIKKGDKVLDMCAAPGGKATIYSEHVGDEGIVVANEYVHSRAMVLTDNVRRWGMGNTIVTSCNSAAFEALPGFFDVVAVDAPCSGEGMFRKEENAIRDWNLENVRECASRQKEILSNAFEALCEGGILLYSTCTFNKTENEDVLDWFEQEHPLELCSVDISTPDKWGILCKTHGHFTTFRMFPNRVEGEGLFVAVARRVSVSKRFSRDNKRKVLQITSKAEREILSKWLNRPEDFSFGRISDNFYAFNSASWKDVIDVISTIPSLYAGVQMGEIFKNTLKPSWALSQYIERKVGATPEIELQKDDALEYLRRHDVILEDAPQGICLLLYAGLSLGYAKKIGNRINNMYPQPLRIQNL